MKSKICIRDNGKECHDELISSMKIGSANPMDEKKVVIWVDLEWE